MSGFLAKQEEVLMGDPGISQRRMNMSAMDQFVRLCHVQRYPKGATVVWPGDLFDSLIFVVSGTLTVSSQREDGQELLLNYVNAGDFINEGGLFSPREPCEVVVKTRCPSELARIPYGELVQALEGELREQAVEIMFTLVNSMSRQLREARRKASRLAFLHLYGRIKTALLDRCHEAEAVPHPEGTLIRITRVELSKIVGCTRESAGRILKVLEDEGMIELRGRAILVIDQRPFGRVQDGYYPEESDTGAVKH